MKILIPYNFSPNDSKSIDFLTQRYGEEKGADITLFHAYTPVPEIDPVNNPIMEKYSRNTSYLKHQQSEQKEVLEQARQKLMENGFDSSKIHCMFVPVRDDVAKDIIRMVNTDQFDVVVLNKNPGNIINYFSRSISKRLRRSFGGNITIHIVT